jgi:Carboxypeptidase regulatory-like domain
MGDRSSETQRKEEEMIPTIYKCRRALNSKRLPLLGVAAVALLAVAMPASAQTSYGSIVGTVKDASGGTIPEAAVSLTNIGTSEHRSASTDSNGNYQFVNLVPGNYKLEIEKSGFKHFTRDTIRVETQNVVRIDTSMEVGAVDQQVEVTAQTPLLQTENATEGQVVEGRIVTDMPLNGRNVFALIALAPGVIPQNGALSGSLNFQISGGMANQGVAWFDGAPFMNVKLNTSGFQPAQDLVLEFQVMSHNVGPEYGGTLNGVINLSSKSGTNEYHGTAYEYFRNKVLNASTFFSNKAGLPRPAYNQNQFGVNVGGPVIKNKTFVFLLYEGNRVRTGTTGTDTFPTIAERGGNLSALSSVVYDPATTTCGGQGLPSCPAGVTSGRTPFPGNIIPATRLDPTSLLLNKWWNIPNQPGLVNNFIINYTTGSDNNQQSARLDQNISDKQHLFVRYTGVNPWTKPVDIYGTNLQMTRSVSQSDQGVIGDTYLLSPSTVLDLNISVLRDYSVRTSWEQGINLTTAIGWPAAVTAELLHPQTPETVVPGYSAGGSRFAGLFLQQISDSQAINGGVTKTLGLHTLHFGAEIRREIAAYGQEGGNANVFNFTSAFTAANPLSPGSTGNAYASYLLGLGQSGNETNADTPYGEQHYGGAYINDTFRAGSRLTLNFGLRWEYTGYWTEKHDWNTVWLPGAINPALQAAGLNYQGDVVLVNSPRYQNRLGQQPHWRLFSPRVGVAWRPTEKTVVRSGFGVFYTPGYTVQNGNPYASPINNSATPWVPTLDGGFTPQAPFSNPFPGGLLPVPLRNPDYETLTLGELVVTDIPNDRTPYMMNWNVDVERQLGGGLVLQVAYVGNRGVHLYDAGGLVCNGMGFDQIPNQYLSLGSQLLQQVPNPFYGMVKAGPLALPTIPYGQLLLPYPQYTGVYSATTAGFDSVYHALQSRVQKRFSSGGTLLVSFEYAKNIGNADTMTGYSEYYQPGETQNFYNISADRSELTYNAPFRGVASYVMPLPVGKGQRLLSGATGAVGKLVSGWGVSGITTFQSGFPIPLLAQPTSISTYFNGGPPRPNVVAGCNPVIGGAAQAKLGEWFNTSCFTQPGTFAFGDAPRADSLTRTQGINNWDFSLTKDTRITERFSLSYRAELYNLFNRVQFNPPGNQLGSSLFGVVSGQLNSPRLVQMALRLLF